MPFCFNSNWFDYSLSEGFMSLRLGLSFNSNWFDYSLSEGFMSLRLGLSFNSNWFDYSCEASTIQCCSNLCFNSNWFDYSHFFWVALFFSAPVSIPTGSITVGASGRAGGV